jgi:predicted RNA-binding protein YlqC (UPF0109 family)
MRDAVEMLVKRLVHDAEAVDVRETKRDAKTSVIEVRVAPADMGKLIGRQGRTVKAIRSLLNAAGAKQNQRFILDIVEDGANGRSGGETDAH